MVKIITFITGNDKKLEEVRQILNADNTISNPTYILQAMKLDLPELQGEPEYIVSEKCRIASLQVGGPVIVEDTSLCFNALGSLPGPYIKWFEEKIGLDGLNNLLMAYEDKSAYAKCIFAYKEGIGSPIHIFTGITNGSIVPPRGQLKFGWDPIFLPDTFTETFAEMDSETKNAISHRYKALQLLKKFLN
jgi:inosine triphosphate pyrophosphatase